MGLVETIRTRMTEATKGKRAAERDLLRSALGEIQRVEMRQTGEISEEDAAKVIRKMMKSNDETIAALPAGPRQDALREENTYLAELLPRSLTVEEIIGILAPQAEALRGAAGEGPATGLAMKALKSAGHSVAGQDVKEAVRRIRDGQGA